MKSASAAANRRARSAANATQRQRDERARRIAQPLALIERPLRLIAHACEPTVDAKGKLTDPGDPWLLRQANDAARRGDGILVKDIARLVLR